MARLRGVELSLEAYRRLAVATAAMLVVIVATGATVRLTGSGLGCEHWPGCTGTVKLPEKGYHSFIEFSNRIVASLTTLVTLAAWLGARLAGAPTAHQAARPRHLPRRRSRRARSARSPCSRT